ncbi:MAG: hypothetical protein ACE5JT_00160 [Nitrosopumilaceae archaeon]
MASVKRLIEMSRRAKIAATSERRRKERSLKKAISLKRGSSSSLSSLQRGLESFHENIGDVSNLLKQRLAQQDSIRRLKSAAEERLNQEQEAKGRAEQEIELADSAEEKESALGRLKIISDRISELKSEIKQRLSTEKKLSKTIEEYSKLKSRLATRAKKRLQNKPVLLDLVKSSKKKSEKLQAQLGASRKREQTAALNLAKITKKFALLKAKQRKIKRAVKKRSKTKRRTVRRRLRKKPARKQRIRLKRKPVKKLVRRAKRKLRRKSRKLKGRKTKTRR